MFETMIKELIVQKQRIDAAIQALKNLQSQEATKLTDNLTDKINEVKTVAITGGTVTADALKKAMQSNIPTRTPSRLYKSEMDMCGEFDYSEYVKTRNAVDKRRARVLEVLENYKEGITVRKLCLVCFPELIRHKHTEGFYRILKTVSADLLNYAKDGIVLSVKVKSKTQVTQAGAAKSITVYKLSDVLTGKA